MKRSCLLIVCTLAGSASLAAQGPHVRALDAAAVIAFERGQRDSKRFRALVAELECTDVIVHIVTTLGLPSRVAGTTRFVAHLGGVRYLRVEISSAITPKMRVAILGHELQHACEVAHSNADSAAAMSVLYESIGRRSDEVPEGFETKGAEQAGHAVWSELGSRTRRLRTIED
jgi:hypothetical protein